MYFPLTQDIGDTPLFIASQMGHSDVVNILISNGADVNLSFEVLYITNNTSYKVCNIGTLKLLG